MVKAASWNTPPIASDEKHRYRRPFHPVPRVATSVRKELWEAAEVFPRQNPEYPLTAGQRELLGLFAPA